MSIYNSSTYCIYSVPSPTMVSADLFLYIRLFLKCNVKESERN